MTAFFTSDTAKIDSTETTQALPPKDSRERVSQWLQSFQDQVCEGLTVTDGGAEFQQDSWTRPEGGGGRSRVMREGRVFEQGGVNFSEVWGKDLPPSILVQRPEAEGHSFYATGTSMVLHPRNPFIPTVHLNYRYFEAGPVWWFGGGIDLTPYYPFEEDVIHFHQTLKQACDRHHPEYYPTFKLWCDEYFYLKHRQETRGVGGNFLRLSRHTRRFVPDLVSRISERYVGGKAKQRSGNGAESDLGRFICVCAVLWRCVLTGLYPDR